MIGIKRVVSLLCHASGRGLFCQPAFLFLYFLSDVSTSRKSFDIKEAPRYQERSVPLKERLALIGLYALTTFFFIALLVWGGFRLLEKYDVR